MKKKLLIGGVLLFIFLALAGNSENQDGDSNPVATNNDPGATEEVSTQEPTNTNNTPPETNPVPAGNTRSFYMGFTPFPPEISAKGVSDVYQFIGAHGDLVAHHLDNGIPWDEALNGQRYSDHYYEDVARRTGNTPAGHKTYVAITPLRFERDSIASTWGKTDNMPTGAPWNGYRLNDDRVKTAFLNYARETVKQFNPDYLAIGVEVNMMITKNPGGWADYLELNKHVYEALSREYPNLPVFATVQYEFLKGEEHDAKPNASMQVPGVRDLMKHSDYLALSTYKYGLDHNPVGGNYFDLARSFGKTMAIAEMGAISHDIRISGVNVRGTEADQANFVRAVLEEANKSNYKFINNFVAIDYDAALGQLPGSIREVAKAWVHTGFQYDNRSAKEVLGIWDNYLALPKR